MGQQEFDTMISNLRAEAKKFCIEKGIDINSKDEKSQLLVLYFEQAFIRAGMIAMKDVLEDFKQKKID